MMKVLGKNNEYMIEYFKTAALNTDLDIRIQNSSALPKSVAARTQTIIDLAKNFPDQFKGEQVLEMLDLAQSEKFIDAATTSIRAAEAENDKLQQQGQDASQAPVEYEDHINHWKTHVRFMQEFNFKAKLPKAAQEQFKDHVMAHEMFMSEQAKKNPAFAQKLMELPLYPLFYVEPPAPPLMMPGMNPPMGAMPSLPGMGATGMPQQPNLPVNPMVGGPEAQAPTLEQLPSLGTQAGPQAPLEPTPGM
jgi:hypothetical protein